MQKVMNQHQNNQFAQDVPFMGGDEKSEDAKSDGTGIFDPGNVHSQVLFICLPRSCIPNLWNTEKANEHRSYNLMCEKV